MLLRLRHPEVDNVRVEGWWRAVKRSSDDVGEKIEKNEKYDKAKSYKSNGKKEKSDGA